VVEHGGAVSKALTLLSAGANRGDLLYCVASGPAACCWALREKGKRSYVVRREGDEGTDVIGEADARPDAICKVECAAEMVQDPESKVVAFDVAKAEASFIIYSATGVRQPAAQQ
jgi:hypothetical protein